ncbi:fimbrillin family protein [uncultured Rikenella sp.]|uniref:fimbrillin family protein n=2 Tax=uncultured Rikenella sp. TaxID=368003 RepID=UPI002634F73C|nr:fimbrillin family protein [uncultured Rikenella sp.]
MKKQMTYIALAGIAFLTLAGCNKRAVGEGTEEETYPVRFAVGEVVASKVVDDEAFEVGDVIGMYAYPHNNSGDAKERKNVPYVQMSNRELLAEAGHDPIVFPDSKSQMLNFIGYYPYSTQADAGGKVEMDIADQTSGMTGAVLYSDNATKITRTLEYVELEFRYVVAQVVFNIQFDPVTMPSGAVSDITAVTFSGDGLQAGYEFDVQTGRTALLGGIGTGSRGRLRLQPGVSACKAAVVPNGNIKNMEVVVELADGMIYTAKPKNMTYVKGTRYTYNLTLKDSGSVILGDAEITDWEPGNDGGTHISGSVQ